jgi:AcrR family transcriptional regulator
MADQLPPSELIPAPGRGQYDRRLPRERRLAEQRERLIVATALALAKSEAPSVAEVIALAGMGRNTFYEYFDDVSHARKAAEARGLRALEDALQRAEARTRTPVERFRAVAGAWLDVAISTPAELRLLLRGSQASGLSVAGEAIATAFTRALETLRASGVGVLDHEPLRLRAVAATAEVFARSLTDALLEPEEKERKALADRARFERVLVDVSVRLLR